MNLDTSPLEIGIVTVLGLARLTTVSRSGWRREEGRKHSGKGSPTSQEFHPHIRISRMLKQGFSGPWSILVSTIFFILRSLGLRGMMTDHLMILPKNLVNLETLSRTSTTGPHLSAFRQDRATNSPMVITMSSSQLASAILAMVWYNVLLRGETKEIAPSWCPSLPHYDWLYPQSNHLGTYDDTPRAVNFMPLLRSHAAPMHRRQLYPIE